MPSDDTIKRLTSELREEMLAQVNIKKTDFFPAFVDAPESAAQTWRVRFELSYDPTVTVELEVEQDMVLGRSYEATDAFPLFPQLDLESMGVSRKHMMLRPTNSALYLIDMGSTNGTQLNGHAIGPHIPHVLSNGDIISIGKLDAITRILKQPVSQNKPDKASRHHDLEVILPMIARAIHTQLSLKDVIKKVIEMTRLYTPADEVSVWLVDEMSGHLYLEEAYGMTNPTVYQMPVDSTMAGEVLRQGKPQRTNRRHDGTPIKLKTGYIAEGVIYVPLTLGQVQMGVISAVHRTQDRIFTDQDEKMMVAIADYAAVAIQNARLYQEMKQDLSRRAKVVSGLQYALLHDVRQHLHSIIGHAGLLYSDAHLENDAREKIQHVGRDAEYLLELFERLVSMARLSQERITLNESCALVDIVDKALQSTRPAANAREISVQAHIEGIPYQIWGNARYLYLSLFNLLDNAIKFTPSGGEVGLALNFAPHEIAIRVTDRGPGIPEQDLLDMFSRYFRSSTPDSCGGPGLGLEIVRATVEAHMGRVNVYNRKSGGAEFIVTLPATIRTDWANRAGDA
ncbi:MAG: ATP-binding protein [Chloroflexota bacterium]|nr:ATP-binding protein [Chloroflexota bacterium]